MTTVLKAGLDGPFDSQSKTELPEGLSVAGIVAQVCPGLADTDHANLRVLLVSDSDSRVVPSQWWSRIRPRAGVRVVIRLVPRGDDLRTVLLAVVSVAAIYAAPTLATSLFAGTSLAGTALATQLVAVGLTIAGTALVNALVPVKLPSVGGNRAQARYDLSGWSNTERRGEPVPLVLGRHRMAPPLAAPSYSEIVGDDHYIRALFCLGYGPLNISDLRIGDTPLSEFEDVTYELREGRVGDAPVSLYPRQVLEETLGVELVRPLPRDSAGEVIDGDAISTPVTRVTATDSASACVILSFSGGLFKVRDSGDVTTAKVEVRIRQRQAGGVWDTVKTLNVSAATRTGFYRQHKWSLPSRGRWEIEVTRMTDETTSTQTSDRVVFAVLQSVRPEYPINMSKPLALIAMRVRASYQLNGRLDNVNAVVQRETKDWTGSAWTPALSRNPASAYLAALQGPSSPFPVPDSAIDFDALAEWHDFCAAKGLRYDAVHETAQSLGDMLAAIAQAGRASPRHDGVTWSIVIDRPQTLAVDHLSARNTSGFTWQRSFTDPPDGFRVRFSDETNDWEPAERIIPWLGHTGDVGLTEELALPGKTHPDEIWREARRRMYEVTHRAETYTLTQDGATRVATRGDLVMGAFDVLDRSLHAARVRAVEGRVIALDMPVALDSATEYGLRYRVFEDDDDAVGTSVVVGLRPVAGETGLLSLRGQTQMPDPGALVQIGPLGQEALAMRVVSVEPGQAFAAHLTLVPAAPEIDTLTDAEVPPVWTGRVGDDITLAAVAPAVPVFVSVASDAAWLGATPQAAPIEVVVTDGAGSSATAQQFRIDHRAAGDTVWLSETAPAADGGLSILGYVTDTDVELRAVALAEDGTASAPTESVTHTVGGASADRPDALDDAAVGVTGGMGHARITVAVNDDNATTHLVLYRVPQGDTLDPDAHAFGAAVAVTRGTTAVMIDGDATRTNLLGNPDFADVSVWSAGTGWTIASGAATHAAGAAGDLSQPVTLNDGAVVRLGLAVSGRSAGVLTPQLSGGTAQSAAGADSNARHVATLTVDSNTSLTLSADSAFDGAVDDVALFVQTAACAPQGAWDYYIAPQNVEGVTAAASGPFSVMID